MIEQMVSEEVARRVNAGFGSAGEVVRSGHIAAYWSCLMRAELEAKYAGYIRAIQKGAE